MIPACAFPQSSVYYVFCLSCFGERCPKLMQWLMEALVDSAKGTWCLVASANSQLRTKAIFLKIVWREKMARNGVLETMATGGYVRRTHWSVKISKRRCPWTLVLWKPEDVGCRRMIGKQVSHKKQTPQLQLKRYNEKDLDHSTSRRLPFVQRIDSAVIQFPAVKTAILGVNKMSPT